MLKSVNNSNEFFFLHKGASEDGLQRTDLIDKCQIIDIRATAAEDMVHKMKKVEVTLDEDVNEGAPVVGQDYILNVSIKNYIANGDDSTKEKFGVARAYNTTASDLYKNLAINLAKNFSREPVKLIKITLKGDDDATEITKTTKFDDLDSITATGIVLEEVEQPWRRGAAPVEFVNFVAVPSTIYVNSMDLVWGVATDVTADNTNVLPNSKKVADLEWFCHKERGDVYGELGWPNNIDTVYMVDASNADGYSMLDIHFYFKGNSMNVGNSEKTLTLVGTKENLTTIVGSLNTMLADYNVVVKESANW